MPITRLAQWSGIFLLPLSFIFCDDSSHHKLFDLKRTIEKEQQLIESLKRELENESAMRKELISNLEAEAAAQQKTIDTLQNQLNCQCQADIVVVEEMPVCTPEIYSHRPNLGKRWGYLTTELLYWHTLEGATTYVTTGQPYVPPTSAASVLPIGEAKSAHFQWTPGFRMQLGYHFDCNHWEIRSSYTYFKNKAHNNQSTVPVDLTNLLSPTFVTQGQPLTKAESDIQLVYQNFDLLLERRILVNDALIINIFSGFTSASFNQNCEIKYKGPSVFTYVSLLEALNGVGLKTGFSSDCHIGAGFGISGLISFSGITGKYSNQALDRSYTISTPNADNINFDSTLDCTRFAYSTQFQLGPKWGATYDTWGVEAFLGYEMNAWFNAHSVYEGQVGSAAHWRRLRHGEGVICFQGVTANLTFIF